MSVKGYLIDLCCQILGNRCHFLFIFLLTKNFNSTIHQPCRLDIMTIGMQIQNGVHVPVKEYFLSVELWIIYLISKGIHDPLKSFLYLRELCYPVKLCIGFKYMKQGIHGLLSDNTVFRKLVIFHFMEFLVKSFLITDLISALRLNDMEQLLCHGKSFLIMGCLIIRGKCINRECLIVGMLGCILRCAVILHGPENTAVFLIHAVFLHEGKSMLCFLKKTLILKKRVGIGEEPCDSAV